MRTQACWKPLSLTGRGSDLSPEALVTYAEERRATGPASDMRLRALSRAILLPPPPLAAIPRPGARLARELSWAGLSPASVLRLSISAVRRVPTDSLE